MKQTIWTKWCIFDYGPLTETRKSELVLFHWGYKTGIMGVCQCKQHKYVLTFEAGPNPTSKTPLILSNRPPQRSRRRWRNNYKPITKKSKLISSLSLSLANWGSRLYSSSYKINILYNVLAFFAWLNAANPSKPRLIQVINQWHDWISLLGDEWIPLMKVKHKWIPLMRKWLLVISFEACF